jgi:hypothetical protein
VTSWTLQVGLITREEIIWEYLLCDSWDEALTAADEIMDDYRDAVLIKVIDPHGWTQEITKPMFRM